VAPEEKTADPLKQKLGRQVAYAALAQRGFKNTSFFFTLCAKLFVNLISYGPPLIGGNFGRR